MHVDIIVTNFVRNTTLLQDAASSLIARHSIDVLIFNPPYVPTEDEEVVTDIPLSSQDNPIAAAWAGGKNGRVVIDRFLPLITVSC